MFVEAVPLFGLIRAIDPVSVQLPRAHSLDPDVPHIAGAVACRTQFYDMGGIFVCGVRVELQPDPRGMSAEDGKIDAVSVRMSAKRQGITDLCSHGANLFVEAGEPFGLYPRSL